MELSQIFTITNIIFNLLGVCAGIIFGAIPGLTATMGVALFLPFTFKMEPTAAFALLLGIYVGGIYGGSITAILIKTPGTGSAAATVVDGYPLAQKGLALEALSATTIASFIGGIFSCFVLIFLAPRLASVALKFGPAEYFAIGLFGLSIVSTLTTGNTVKGLISACIGLLIAMIGMDPVTGSLRLTFGSIEMIGGVEFVVALIGLFAISEVIFKVEGLTRTKGLDLGSVKGKLVSKSVIWANKFNILRSSVIGTIIGIIPATGGGMAAWLAYNEAKRASKHPEEFGKGCFEGVIAPEASNNAVTGGALVPLMTLGIPGDVVTAVLMGALMIQGLTPGPALFRDNPQVVTGIYAMMILANIFMLLIGLCAIKLFVKILKVPTKVLMPVVLIMCFVGAYAISNSVFDMKAAFVLGILGYVLQKAKYPMAPILLGLILEPIIESNFRRAITISHGSLSIFLRPISLVFILIAVICFTFPLISANYKAYKEKKRSN